jgi:hypothetical protein
MPVVLLEGGGYTGWSLEGTERELDGTRLQFSDCRYMNAALRFQYLPVFAMSSLPVCPVCQIDMLLSSEQQAILHPELQTLECGKCQLVFTRPITREDVARRAVRHAQALPQT